MRMRIGIIGCGQMGHRRAEGIIPSPDTVSYVYDVDGTRATGMAETFGARPAKTAEELIGRTDAVIVATPNIFLAPYAAMGLELRRPVLVEKPGAVAAAGLEKLVSCARAQGVPFQVGYSLIQYSAVSAFLEAAADIGEPGYLRASYGHGGRPGMDGEWRADPAFSGGGELLDQGVHLVHLALLLLGPATGVRCVLSSGTWHLPVEDTASLLLRHERGSASLAASWCFWRNEFRLDITGPRGSVHLSGLGGNYGESRLVVRRRPSQAGPPVSREVTIVPHSAWETEWLDFRELVSQGGQGNGDLAVSVLRVLERARDDAAR